MVFNGLKMKVVTVDQMQEIERRAATSGLTVETLMENAGRAIAEEVKKNVGNVAGQRILILIGPGNNGGDGLVATRHLDDWGAEVNLYLCHPRAPDDKNLKLTQDKGIFTVTGEQDDNFDTLVELLSSADIIIDAIFGTGKSRPLKGIFAQVLRKVIETKAKRPELAIIAVDTPSGLDANTGAIDAACPFADVTITLGYPKPGLFNFPGADRVGKLIVADIGIPSALAEDIVTEIITPEWLKKMLPKRPAGANKGSFGRVMVIAGSINYIGAAYLACMGAVRVGAGLVTLATARSLQPILAAKLTETTYFPLPEVEPGIIASEATGIVQQGLANYDVLAMGCGLGQSPQVSEFVRSTLFNLPKSQALVLDADALNILAQKPQWWQKLNENAILTPHPGEMARLAGLTVEAVQQNRLQIAIKMAKEWGETIVLKGAYTVIAAPDGRANICPIANAGLASAGTGDVLTGAIAGLVAQGLPLFEAASCGVYLHALAGEKVRTELGDAGMLASDLLPVLPRIIKEIKEGRVSYFSGY